MRQTEQSMSAALTTIRSAHESFQALGGGIAPQQAPAPQAPARQAQAQQTRQAPPQQARQPAQQQPRQAQQPKPQPQNPPPQGKPDPLSAKIQRIERDEG